MDVFLTRPSSRAKKRCNSVSLQRFPVEVNKMRQISNYKKHQASDMHPPSVIHQTFDPELDTLENVRFDIKMAGSTCHMSTTMYLEREFEIQTQLPHSPAEEFTINLPDRKWRDYDTTTAKFTVKPGFVLQENAERAFFRFNAGSVTLDSDWIGSYRNLYKKELMPYIRGSGRRFANHNDDISHMRSMIQERHNNDYLPERKYIHPDRADRRVILDRSGPDVMNPVYYALEPLDDHLLFMMNLTLEDIFEWSIDPSTTITDDDGDEHEHILNRTFQIGSAAVRRHYDLYHSAADTARLAQVQALILPLINRNTGEIQHNDPRVAQLATIMGEYFAKKPGDDDDQKLDDFHDHYALGVDLRKPFPAIKNTFKFHIKTVTYILQFMKLVHQFFGGYSHNELEVINNQRKELKRLNEMMELASLYLDKKTEFDNVNAQITALGADSKAALPLIYKSNHLLAEIQELEITFKENNVGDPDLDDDMDEQVQHHIDTLEDAIELNLEGWRADHSRFGDPHRPDFPSFIPSVQMMSRYEDFLFGNTHKNENSAIHQTTKTSKITLYEPIILGPCKPSEYTEIGCWSNNSCILPFIERFTFGLKFKKNAHYFDLDQYDDKLDTITDYWRLETRYPRLMPKSVKSKLHVTFVEEPVSLPTSIPYIDTVTYQLGRTSVAKNNTVKVDFRDLSLRRTPKMIIFYTKMFDTREPINEPTIFSDKAASVVGVTLRTDLSPRVYKIDDRTTVDMVTLRNYPGYFPQLGVTGNCLALPFHELPRRKIVAARFNNLHGDIKISQGWSNIALDVEVYATFLYGDTFFDIEHNYQRGILELDDLLDV